MKDPGQPTPTFYGNLYLSQAESGQWLAWLWGLGAFTDGSAYIQGGLVGAAAGRYDNETPPGTLTEGTASGIVYPTSFISHVTPDPLAQGLFDIAYLYGFSGEMLTLVGDGYFQGLLGDEGRVSMWSATSTDPAEGLMIGLYGPPAQTMDYPSHVFNAHIWPTNYPDGLSKTTTDGGSFWGYLGGIHRDIAGIPVDEIEGRITTIYIDPSQNAGFLLGSFSGSFDVDNVQWWTDDLSVYPVQMATGIGIAPADLYSNISQMPYYMDESPEFTFEVPPDSYAMGYAVERPFDSTGEF